MNSTGPERPVTLKDIARKAGVNPSTVSRAMRNDPRISEVVRKRINRLAQKMGYRPNPLVAALGAQVRGYRRAPRGVAIAVLNCWPGTNKSSWRDLYIEGITTRTEQLGYRIEHLLLAELDDSVPRLNKILRARGLRGLIILPVPEEIDLSKLDCTHLALATISYSMKNPIVHRAASDYF